MTKNETELTISLAQVANNYLGTPPRAKCARVVGPSEV